MEDEVDGKGKTSVCLESTSLSPNLLWQDWMDRIALIKQVCVKEPSAVPGT